MGFLIWWLHWEHANMYIEHTEHRKQQGPALSAEIFTPFPLAHGAKENFGY